MCKFRNLHHQFMQLSIILISLNLFLFGSLWLSVPTLLEISTYLCMYTELHIRPLIWCISVFVFMSFSCCPYVNFVQSQSSNFLCIYKTNHNIWCVCVCSCTFIFVRANLSVRPWEWAHFQEVSTHCPVHFCEGLCGG